MTTEILEALRERCAREGARLLLGAERGSRGYGTGTSGSDWDVVGIVAFEPRAYARVEPPPRTWETLYAAWGSVTLADVTHAALRLVRGNVKYNEVAHSACVLHAEPGVAEGLRALYRVGFDLRSVRFQYLQAMDAAEPHLVGGAPTARSCLHYLLPLMAGLCVEAKREPAPVGFLALAQACPDQTLRRAAVDALAAKRESREAPAPLSPERLSWILDVGARYRSAVHADPVERTPVTAERISAADDFAWTCIAGAAGRV